MQTGFVLQKTLMKTNASQRWRQDGEEQAFNPVAWSFKAEQFGSSATLLLDVHDREVAAFFRSNATPTLNAATAIHEGAAIFHALLTAEFLLCLAIELVAKARYLKLHGPSEDIYTHQTLDLFEAGWIDAGEVKLLAHASRYVVWAGRYPTPRWTKESLKEGYDVPSKFVDGVEHFHAEDIPNTGSRQRCAQLVDLFKRVHASAAPAA